MTSLLTTVLVAATALVWLFVVTLPPASGAWAGPLRDVALFLSAASAARLVEMMIASLISGRRARHATDLVRAMSSVIIYGGALVSWLYFGLGFNVTSLLATSAVVTVVFGFALQTTLGNLFAGLSLELERPIRVGDYLRKPPYEGTIVALKWRSIHLRTSTNSLVILPNSALAATPVEMIPKLSPVRHMATFHVPDDHPPARVLGLIREALAGALHPAILADPAPSAVMVGTEANSAAILYGARFYTDQPADLATLTSLVLARTWSVLGRDGIGMTGRPLKDRGYPDQPVAFRAAPHPIPPEVIAAGSRLHFGAGEALPPDLAGFILRGSLQEEVRAEEFDAAAAVVAISVAAPDSPSPARLDPATCAAIAREAAPFLGPIAATLTSRFAQRTDDPYLIFHALAARIPSEVDRRQFLGAAPSGPVRRLGEGACFGWSGLLGLEPGITKRRGTPEGAEILAFSRPQVRNMIAQHGDGPLVAILSGAAGLETVTVQDLRARLVALVADQAG